MLIFPKPQTLNKDETQQKKFKSRSLHFLDKTKSVATKNTISMICKQLANMQFVVHEEATAETSIALYMNPHMFQKAQSYSLYVEEQICLVASCDAGLYYGLCSLVQLLQYATTNNDTLPFVKVLDYPSIVNRGIMLDVSRDKVHSMETLYHLADLFSSWKINQIQLYIEHTFAYKQKYVTMIVTQFLEAKQHWALRNHGPSHHPTLPRKCHNLVPIANNDLSN